MVLFINHFDSCLGVIFHISTVILVFSLKKYVLWDILTSLEQPCFPSGPSFPRPPPATGQPIILNTADLLQPQASLYQSPSLKTPASFPSPASSSFPTCGQLLHPDYFVSEPFLHPSSPLVPLSPTAPPSMELSSSLTWPIVFVF